MPEDGLVSRLNNISGHEELTDHDKSENIHGGLLTQRVLNSANFQHIFYYQDHVRGTNNVVFVSETTVQVRKLLVSGEFRTVAVKDDFDGRIRAATLIQRSSPELKNLSIYSQYSTLVVTLESKDLVLINLTIEDEEDTELSFDCEPLPTRLSPLQEPGDHVAADSGSRAVAVAAYENTVILYRLVPDSRDVIGFSLPLRTELVISAITFLIPPAEDGDCISLVIVGTKAGRAQLSIYSWSDTKSRLMLDDIQHSSHRLGKEHGMPVLVAALKCPGSFLLVCERIMAVYQYGHDGSIEQQHSESLQYHRGPDGKPPLAAQHRSRRAPLWTAWTRSGLTIPPGSDIIFLAREDGLLCRLCFDRKLGKVFIETIEVVASLSTTVDNCFTTVCPSPEGLEQILVIGNSGTALYQFPRLKRETDNMNSLVDNSTQRLHPIRNLQMLMHSSNLVVIEGGDSRSNGCVEPFGRGTNIISDPPRLFTTSAHDTTGTVSEFRYGLQLRLFPFDGFPDMAGTDAIWFFTVGDGLSCFLCSFPWQSIFLCGPSANISHFDLTAETTLAAGVLSKASNSTKTTIVQVTATCLQVFEIDYENKSRLTLHIADSYPIDRALTAVLSAGAEVVLFTSRAAEGYIIQGYSIVVHDGQYSLVKLENFFQLASEPSFTALFQLPASNDYMEVDSSSNKLNAQDLYLVVGMTSGEVYVVRVTIDDRFEAAGIFSPNLPVACDSVAVLIMAPRDNVMPLFSVMMLCGFRDGTVRLLGVEVESGSESVVLKEVFLASFGALPAKTMVPHPRENVAYILSGSTLCRVDLNNSPPDQPTITQVFMDDPTNTTQRPVMADILVPISQGGLPGSFMVIVADRACIGALSEAADVVSKEQPCPGSPKRLMHSEYLKTMIICATTIEINSQSRKRFPLSTFLFVDPVDPGSALRQQSTSPAFVCAPGEKVNDLTEWFCRRGNRTYHFLIATVQVTAKDGPMFGQLKYFKVIRHRDGRLTMTVAHESRESEPVYAIVQKGDDSLVYGSGLDLKLRRFKPDEGRFHKPSSFRLGAPAVAIAINEPYLYITTASNGFLILRYDSADAETFTLVFSEDRARLGITNLPLALNLILVSDRERQIAYLQWTKNNDMSLGVPATYHATLPSSIIRLVKLNSRPPWKYPRIGAVERDILGLATDGSLHAFSILTKPAWLLLSFLQIMCITSNTICPHRNRSFINHSNNSSMQYTSRNHVDGDILGRLVRRRDAKDILDMMLDADFNYEDTPNILTQFSTEKRRLICERLLNSILQEALHDQNRAQEQCRVFARSGDLVQDLLRLLRVMLELPF